MDITYIIIIIELIFAVVIGFCTGYVMCLVKHISHEKQKKDISIYFNLDPEQMIEEIDKLIDRNIEQYTFNEKFYSDNYLSDTDIDAMSKDISRNIILNLSDLYIEYIRCLIKIPEDENPIENENLIRFIATRVNYKVLDFVEKYNNKEN